MNVKVHDLMTESVVTTQPHNDKIHRVIVTHEQQIVGAEGSPKSRRNPGVDG